MVRVNWMWRGASAGRDFGGRSGATELIKHKSVPDSSFYTRETNVSFNQRKNGIDCKVVFINVNSRLGKWYEVVCKFAWHSPDVLVLWPSGHNIIEFR